MTFSWTQIVGALAWPVSYFSLVLGTISWHFHIREIVLENLSFLDRMKVVPFFFIIITTKVWVTADLCNTIHAVMEGLSGLFTSLAIVAPFALTFGLQVALHWALRFPTQQTLLGSIGGLTTLKRPTHEESKDESVIQLYKKETLVSSLAYATMASISALTKMKIVSSGVDEAWESWLSLAFVCLYFLTTQIYTRYLNHTLFSIKSSQDNAIELDEFSRMNFEDTNLRKKEGCELAADKPNGDNNESNGKVSELLEINQKEINEADMNEPKSCEQTLNRPNNGKKDVTDEDTLMSKARIFHRDSMKSAKKKLLDNENWIKIILLTALAIIGIYLTVQIHSVSGKCKSK